MNNSKPILLVEDDQVDAATIKRAIEDLEISANLVHMIDGEQALNYLRDKCNKKPSVIFLDLNMPKMDGIEFLKVIKADKTLQQIPVVVLTVSSQEQDIVESFNLGIAGYVTKPAGYEEFIGKLQTIDAYWTFSELPP